MSVKNLFKNFQPEVYIIRIIRINRLLGMMLTIINDYMRCGINDFATTMVAFSPVLSTCLTALQAKITYTCPLLLQQ